MSGERDARDDEPVSGEARDEAVAEVRGDAGPALESDAAEEAPLELSDGVGEPGLFRRGAAGVEGWLERGPEEVDPAGVLESILFAARRPLGLRDLRRILRGALSLLEQEGIAVGEEAPARRLAALERGQLEEALRALALACRDDPRRGFLLVEVADGYQLVSKPEHAFWLRPLVEERRRNLLSRPALETLAVIAYRQPVTRADIEQVRGVSVEGVLRTLLERGLVCMAGRSDQPGRPMLYETTRLFLEHFGLRTVRDLPAYQELSRAPAREVARQAEWLGGAERDAAQEPRAAGGSIDDTGESAPRD